MKNSVQKNVYLFYYNIYKFQCYTQCLVHYPTVGFAKLIGLGNIMAKRSGLENWDEYILNILNDPKGGISLNFAGMQMSLLIFFTLLIPWNLLGGLLRFPRRQFWFGWIVLGVCAFVVSFYVAPSGGKRYLKNFAEFELMSNRRKRISALITFVIIVGILSGFVGSFIYLLRSVVH